MFVADNTSVHSPIDDTKFNSQRCRHTSKDGRKARIDTTLSLFQPNTRKNFRHMLGLIVLGLFLSLFVAVSAQADISKRKSVKSFIRDMVKTEKFDEKELTQLFKKIKIRGDILKAIKRPAEAKPWHQYRKIFLTRERIQGGVKFWQENEQTLQKAEAEYGVPAEIVVAILGVETKYGNHKGGFHAAEALATLGFGYPRRAKFFKNELKQLLLLSREEEVDPYSIMGSYAGALGEPQFMPSSFRKYAVDYDGDKKRDLINNSVDAIASVANYFKKHGWVTDGPITVPAKVKGGSYKKIVKKGIKPRLTVKKLEKSGIKPQKEVSDNEKAALIELKLKKGREYWLGLSNFYVITRYNHSQHYAMAVYQLSQEIVNARKLAAMADNSSK